QTRYFVRSILFLAALVVSVPAHAASSKLDRALRRAVDTQSAQKQPVIVRAKAGQIAAVRNWLKAHGDAVDSEQTAIDALTTSITLDPLNHRARVLEPAGVSLNPPVRSFATPSSSPPSPAATVLRQTFGLAGTSPTGKGVGVAIIDTGVTPSTDFLGRFT